MQAETELAVNNIYDDPELSSATNICGSMEPLSLTDDISNISIISGDVPSYNTDPASGDIPISELLSESSSRPLSRNLTTSCLSTTATKDGIEGKRLHRRGPTAFANSIIQGMFVDSKPELISGGDKLNMGNVELHNSIFKKELSNVRSERPSLQKVVDNAPDEISSSISMRSVDAKR